MSFVFDVVDRVHADQTLWQLLVWKIFNLGKNIVIGFLDGLSFNFKGDDASEKPQARFLFACAGRKGRNEWPVKVAIGVAPVPVAVTGNELVAIDF